MSDMNFILYRGNWPVFLRGSTLPTVLVVCVLMLLVVFSVYLYWNGAALFVAEINLKISGHDDLESGFVLYRNDPTFLEKFAETGAFQLYEEDPLSEIRLQVSFWGAYERVSLFAAKGKVASNRLYGQAFGWQKEVILYYPDHGSAVTVTGGTTLHGKAALPRAGIKSSQLEAEFFCGEFSPQLSDVFSGKELPTPVPGVYTYIQELMRMPGRLLQSDGTVELVPDVISDLESLPADAILIARKISVKEGAVLQGQLMATDTLLVGPGAHLKYPSGLYAGEAEAKAPYIELAGESRVEGYVILPGSGEDAYTSVQYRQAPQASVSGLIYINGTAQVQGNVCGVLLLRKAVYTQDYQYYPDTFYNMYLEGGNTLAYPVWLPVPYLKKEVKWLDGN